MFPSSAGFFLLPLLHITLLFFQPCLTCLTHLSLCKAHLWVFLFIPMPLPLLRPFSHISSFVQVNIKSIGQSPEFLRFYKGLQILKQRKFQATNYLYLHSRASYLRKNMKMPTYVRPHSSNSQTSHYKQLAILSHQKSFATW